MDEAFLHHINFTQANLRNPQTLTIPQKSDQLLLTVDASHCYMLHAHLHVCKPLRKTSHCSILQPQTERTSAQLVPMWNGGTFSSYRCQTFCCIYSWIYSPIESFVLLKALCAGIQQAMPWSFFSLGKSFNVPVNITFLCYSSTYPWERKCFKWL